MVVAIALVSGCRAGLSGESSSPSTPSSGGASGSVSPAGVTQSPAPIAFSVTWSQVPWTGRVEDVAYDRVLGLWLALGWDEMWTSVDGETWERHRAQGQ